MSKLSLEETTRLKILLNQIDGLVDTIAGILNNDKAAEHSRYVSFRDMAIIYNNLADDVLATTKFKVSVNKFNVEHMPGYADTLWGEQKRILEQVLLQAKLIKIILQGNLDFAEDEFDNIANFIFSKLRSTIFRKPDKETEIQDAIESLLIGRGMSKGIDYDRETGKLEFSGKEFIPDFIIPNLKACVEVKLLREGRKSKIIEEISADITAYGKIYERQLFIVYDLGIIQNEAEFKRDIENIGSVKLVVVKH